MAGPQGRAPDNWRQVMERLLVFTPTDRFRAAPRLRANLPWVHARTNRHYSAAISRALQDFSGGKFLLFNFVYDFPEIMGLSVFHWRCYVCFDEFPRMWRKRTRGNWLRSAYQSRIMQTYENRVARAADCCLTPHIGLRDKLLKICNNVHLLHHAHEFRESNFSKEDSGNGGGRFEGMIKVAYMGYIHYRLLDQWLLRILKTEDMRLHLIGPVNPNYDIGEFAGYENFVHVPPVSGEALAKVLEEMDVLIMPYDPATPEVEVLTYIATRKPIVTSDLPNLVRMPEGVLYKARDPNGFVVKIRQSYREDHDELRELRAEIATANTWDKRGEELHGYLKEALGDRIPDLV